MNKDTYEHLTEYWMVKELRKGKEVHQYHPKPTKEGAEYKKRTWAMIRGLDVEIRWVTFEENWKKAGYYLSLVDESKS